MRVHDSLTGAVLLLLSLAVLWHIQGFPPAAGQQFGPALFPGLIAGGMAIASAALVWHGWRAGGPLVALSEGLRSPRHMAALVVTLAAMVFYILAADTLGFILCSVVILVAMQLALGVRLPMAVGVALLATLVIHACFYKLLRVPLPWGWLQPIAW
ncbi:tripartite tricarboxylate transporter TctB family protein [Pseudorhodoferax sp. Leaf267]|uniref:tripartite tricarboxylate transporter TctB family protein n=1 Tax=Pseudorhodoferax sp. Leaf267 TaxID=1736316 RepID=UPI000701AFF6|nr:tripartite tricarboxylate transporter TctB family protein [Pseudorhodoferax sp. Leaf267]KQP13093.1 hypothetical protein ASF43_18435 [Pseudorhodoferax sp. Leaf267]